MADSLQTRILGKVDGQSLHAHWWLSLYMYIYIYLVLHIFSALYQTKCPLDQNLIGHGVLMM